MTEEERKEAQKGLIREQLRNWHLLIDVNEKMHFHYLMENLDIRISIIFDDIVHVTTSANNNIIDYQLFDDIDENINCLLQYLRGLDSMRYLSRIYKAINNREA